MTTQSPQTQLKPLSSPLTSRQLKEMLVIQGTLNKKVNPEWRDAGYEWRDAMMVEAVELFDHLNWKWWKTTNKGVDWDQVRMEAVDIWHFILSEHLTMYNDEALLGNMVTLYWPSVTEEPEEVSVKVDCRELIAVISAKSVSALRECEPMAGALDDVIFHFGVLLSDLGMSLSDLYKMYVGKSKLNELRWANGYGTTYVKNWFGEEDNQYLSRLLDSLNAEDENFATDVSLGLSIQYLKVLTEDKKEKNGK